MTKNGISVIIPVYNERDILKENVTRLDGFLTSHNITHQIIIVDNGSTDETPQIGLDLEQSNPSITFYRIDRKTVGGAFWLAAENSRFPKIATVDADLSIDLSFLSRSFELLDCYDIVVGSKVAGNQERNLVRTIGSKLYIAIADVLLRLKVTDFSIGAKAYQKEKILRFRNRLSDWTGYVVELITLARINNLSIKEIPVRCTDTRKGKFNIIHEGLYRYWHLFCLIIRSCFWKKEHKENR